MLDDRYRNPEVYILYMNRSKAMRLKCTSARQTVRLLISVGVVHVPKMFNFSQTGHKVSVRVPQVAIQCHIGVREKLKMTYTTYGQYM